MSIIHVSKTGHAYLVIDTSGQDRLSSHLYGQRYLPGLGGWMVGSPVIAMLDDFGFEKCQECISDGPPCDDWLSWVMNRFEAGQHGSMRFLESGKKKWSIGEARQRLHGWQEPAEEPKKKPTKPTESTDQQARDAAAELGLEWPATRPAIKRAFKIAALKRHPDMGGDAQAMRKAVEARDLLLRTVK